MKLTRLGFGIILSLFLFGCGLDSETSDSINLELESNGLAAHNIRIFEDIVEPELIEAKKGELVEFFITNHGSKTGRFIVEEYFAEEKLVEGRTVSLMFRADKKGSFDFGDFNRPLGKLVVK